MLFGSLEVLDVWGVDFELAENRLNNGRRVVEVEVFHDGHEGICEILEYGIILLGRCMLGLVNFGEEFCSWNLPHLLEILLHGLRSGKFTKLHPGYFIIIANKCCIIIFHLLTKTWENHIYGKILLITIHRQPSFGLSPAQSLSWNSLRLLIFALSAFLAILLSRSEQVPAFQAVVSLSTCFKFSLFIGCSQA